MLNHLVAIGFGTLVFLVFMLVFMRRDDRGKRGARLAGCGHHDSDQGCQRCRGTQPGAILPQPPPAAMTDPTRSPAAPRIGHHSRRVSSGTDPAARLREGRGDKHP